MEPPARPPLEPTVFVVDDDATILAALERLLRSAGLAVETFPSAKAFLERRPVPDEGALILDVQMPGIDGPMLQEWLVTSGSKLAIYFMSGVDDDRTRDDVIAAGARGWFPKPVDGEQLLLELASAARTRDPR